MPDQNAHRPGADRDPDSESFPFRETEQGDETAPEDGAAPEPETGDETAPEDDPVQGRRRRRRLAAIGMCLLGFLFLVTTIVTTISLIRGGDGSPEVSCDPVERIDLGGASDDFTVTIGSDRKSTRLNSSHVSISYAVFCLKKKKVIKHCIMN